MPKRSCPFDDDLLPQLKTHIGQKEVDTGVCNEKRMKDVYDKTLNLLMEGAKALSHKLNLSAQADPIDLPSPRVVSSCKSSERILKQMVLNNKLQLETSDKIIKDVQVDLCGCCRVIDQNTLSKCYYCDQVLCSSCLLECITCSELFCQNCSLPVYDREEHNICVNCYEKCPKH